MDILPGELKFTIVRFVKCKYTSYILQQVNNFYRKNIVINNKYKLFKMLILNSSKNGHLNISKWARENGCEWNKTVCSNAAKNGHFEILKWARENGCDWDSRVCSHAAKNGHFKILKWARENGCEWNRKLCSNAAKYGLEKMDVIGIALFVHMQLKMVILKF